MKSSKIFVEENEGNQINWSFESEIKKKKQGNKIKNETAYFNSKPFTIRNEIEQLNSWRTVSGNCQMQSD